MKVLLMISPGKRGSSLDRFDELGDDPRLEALDSILVRIFAGAGGALVIAATPTEAEYVQAHLLTAGHAVVGMSTGTTPRVERRRLMEELSGATVLVATNSILELGETLPPNVEVVSWSEPRAGTTDRNRLAILPLGPGRAIHQLIEDRD